MHNTLIADTGAIWQHGGLKKYIHTQKTTLYKFIIPFGKFGPPYLGKRTSE